ncbi:Afadin and alpha-actinin-binding-domain-containing protein [Coniochaeta sp. 2T2.1]|nr:Afadin and alpha-actinin-binding-domain-containing protein [Coniochaeta sp. 2T2.1]
MIDLDNLRTASLYINNQLLSRGLLRDGEKINFAHPGDSDSQLADTMGKIMGVVNDLILRRDRDADHRESLSTTLRALRAESLRLTNDVQQLRDKQAEAQRRASLAEAAETSMRAQLKSAEATIHKLKDEAARMKTLVAQTRAACANEVRKRDRQIDGLKKAVTDTGRTRGATKNPGITTINVTGEIGGEGCEKGTPRGVTESEAYDLRMETNSFLAELAKGLSAENETLLELVRRTTQSLKEMSGWDKEDGAQGVGSDGHALALLVNPDEMAHDIEAILEHLRTILTNPSFVPIEEVVMREEEISRLRDGWEKMETRWAEAVHLMDGWRRRMQADGRPVNVEELKMGLRLSPVRIRDVAETANSLGLIRLTAVREETEEPSMIQSPSPADSLHLGPAPEYEDELEASDAESSIFEDDVDMNELDVEEPNVEVLQQSVMFSSPPLPSPPQLSPLKDSYSAGNRGQAEPIPFKSRKGLSDFTTIVEENTRDLAQETQAPEPPPHRTQPQSPTRKPVPRSRPTSRAETPPTSVDMSDIKSTPDSDIFMRASKEETSAKKPAPAATTRQRTATATASSRPSRPQPAPSTTRTATRPAPPRPTTTRTTRPQASSQPQPPPQSRPQPSPQTHPTESSPTAPPPPASTTRNDRTTSAQSTTSTTSALSTTSSRSPTKSGSSRLPLPRTNNLLPQPQQSPLTMATIAAKLAASEREADAARVRAKLKAARLARMGRKETVLAPPTQDPNTQGNEDKEKEPVKRDWQAERGDEGRVRKEWEAPARTEAESAGRRVRREEKERDADEVDMIPVEKPRKRERRTSKAASRRRSTLNPFELQSLIQGNVVEGV